MISILYVSKRDESTTAKDVAAILQISRERNTSADVTGLLICTESMFAQVLEGPMDDVLETLERIHLDCVAPVTSPSLVKRADLPMSPSSIAKLPLAAVGGQENYWRQWFDAAGLEMPGDCIWSSHKQRALALDYALAGNAVALADLPLIRNELEAGSLVCLSEVYVTLDRGIHLAVPPGPFFDARLTAFGDWLGERVSRLSAQKV